MTTPGMSKCQSREPKRTDRAGGGSLHSCATTSWTTKASQNTAEVGRNTTQSEPSIKATLRERSPCTSQRSIARAMSTASAELEYVRGMQ